MSENKPMRELMPVCCEFVDLMREAGLTDDAAIKKGIKVGTCYFSENGHEIGRADLRAEIDSKSLNLNQIDVSTDAERAALRKIHQRNQRGRE